MSKIKILITDGMAKEGVETLKKVSDFEVDLRKETAVSELEKIIDQYQCIVIRSATTLTQGLIEKAKSMQLILRAGAGVDNIDVAYATEKKIPVMNTASANSLAAAEQTIALLFAMFRQVPQASASLSAERWDRALFKGYEVTGKTLGVVGLGNIGHLVAQKALGLGMKVIGYDPTVKSESDLKQKLIDPSNMFQLATDLQKVATESDVLTFHIPKTKQTAHLVNIDFISKMKEKSFIINCARGGIVDETAVIKALDSGKLAGAAFDVFEKEPPTFPNPLFSHPKIVCTPHLGASTFEAQDRVAATASAQIIGFFLKNEKAGIINGL